MCIAAAYLSVVFASAGLKIQFDSMCWCCDIADYFFLFINCIYKSAKSTLFVRSYLSVHGMESGRLRFHATGWRNCWFVDCCPLVYLLEFDLILFTCTVVGRYFAVCEYVVFHQMFVRQFIYIFPFSIPRKSHAHFIHFMPAKNLWFSLFDIPSCAYTQFFWPYERPFKMKQPTKVKIKTNFFFFVGSHKTNDMVFVIFHTKLMQNSSKTVLRLGGGYCFSLVYKRTILPFIFVFRLFTQVE